MWQVLTVRLRYIKHRHITPANNLQFLFNWSKIGATL